MMRRRLFTLILLAALGTLFTVPLLHAAGHRDESPPTREYLIKAAFLYNLTKFVDWQKQDDEPLTLCILGDDPFGESIESIRAKKVRGKALRIVRTADMAALPASCDMLFVCLSEAERLPEILSLIKGRSVLTVSDMDDFALSGGMVHLRTAENRIRFAVNVDATRRANLTVSANLLRLAIIVHDEEVRP